MNTRKPISKLLALVLTAALALSLTPLTALAADYDGHWAAPYIEEAHTRGWMLGDGEGNFLPDSPITRAEFAMMLWRAMGSPAPTGDCPLTDVPDDTYYREAATALHEAGIVSGYGDGLFGPNDTLTREMAFVMLARAFGLKPEDAAYTTFDDFTDTSVWAADAVSALVERGYVEGSGGMLLPQKALTRGEMAKLLIAVFDGEGGKTAAPGDLVITLTQDPTAATTGSVKVSVKVESADEVDYIGWQSSAADAVYSGKSGFTDITAAKEFSVTVSGWYAVCATTSAGGFAFKLINITNIQSSGGGGYMGTSTVTNISTPEQLAAIGQSAASLKKSYKLTADIEITGEWTPIGDYGTPFTGSFDGGGYTITFTNADIDAYSVGLFGFIGEGGTVKGLTVAGEFICIFATEFAYLGGVAGYNEGSIENCAVKAGLTLSGDYVYAGGVAGWNEGRISNCYATGGVTAEDSVDVCAGGVVGCNSGSVENCYATGDVTASGDRYNWAGGVVGINAGRIDNCYATGDVTASGGSDHNCAGGVVGDNNDSNPDFHPSVTGCVALSGSVSASGASDPADDNAGRVVGYNNSGRLSNNFARNGMSVNTVTVSGNHDDENGSGVFDAYFYEYWWSESTGGPGFEFGQTAAAPWVWDSDNERPILYWQLQIFNFDQLKAIGENAQSLAGVYVLAANITVPAGAWTPIGNDSAPFTGSFDGGGYTITFKDAAIVAEFAGLFGFIDSVGLVQNLTVAGKLNAEGYTLGGVVGENYGSIENCAVTASLTLTGDGFYSLAGGVAGTNFGEISECYATGSVAASGSSEYIYSGGLVGGNDGDVENCYAAGNVTAKDGDENYAGGLVGDNQGSIASCYATGSVTASGGNDCNYAGGIVGFNEITGSVTNCVALNKNVSATGSGSGTDDYAGRVAGHNIVGTLSGNYGHYYMTLNSTSLFGSTEIGADKIHGADVSKSGINSQEWWDGTQNLWGTGSGWQFASAGPWQWQSGYLPFLNAAHKIGLNTIAEILGA